MDNDQYRNKWQQRWMEGNVFAADNASSKPPYYVLDMFPYPSGNGLHVGHAVGYIGTDIVARKKRMEGFNVLHPMGWDAFGLPAEQYAIKTGVHPAETTKMNCKSFKRQLKLMGLSYDWSREIDTSNAKYYKWTQFLFLKLYERGLVYEKEENVWWCEALQTVLANEEVIDGRSERGDHPCIKKPLKQWVVKITEYAERLLAGLDRLDWPESVKKMQREWIGRTEGLDVDLLIQEDVTSALTLFTSEADTLYGSNAVFLCTEHPYVKKLCQLYDSDLSARIAALQDPKLAVDGLPLERHARHPLTGALLPIFVVNYLAFDGEKTPFSLFPILIPKRLRCARASAYRTCPCWMRQMHRSALETPQALAVSLEARRVSELRLTSSAIIAPFGKFVTGCAIGCSRGKGTGASPFRCIGTITGTLLQPTLANYPSSCR